MLRGIKIWSKPIVGTTIFPKSFFNQTLEMYSGDMRYNKPIDIKYVSKYLKPFSFQPEGELLAFKKNRFKYIKSIFPIEDFNFKGLPIETIILELEEARMGGCHAYYSKDHVEWVDTDVCDNILMEED